MRRLRMKAAGAAFGLMVGLVLSPAGGASAAAGLEDDVLAEINFARTKPQAYARWLREEAGRSGSHGEQPWARQDPGAVAEAVDFLMRQPALPPLRRHAGLESAAQEHASSQGTTRQLGHVSPSGRGLAQRLQRHGVYAGLSAENISYGQFDSRDVVRQLIVDSGVPSRGHRANIFGRSYQAAGVSCSRHRAWGAMCVIDFAGALVQR